MKCQLETVKPLAYLLVIVGCMLALVTALAPLPTGSYKLSAGFLIFGMIPYVVYGSLTETLKGCSLATAGIFLLTADLLARYGADITSAGQTGVSMAIGLSLLLILIVLPMGAAVGKLLSRMLS
ncbi:MAG: hypothetical protein ABFS22_09485 [Pseudomonadota bacterium]